MDSTAEVWKPVVGYEGLYEVSDQGNVRSLFRAGVARNGTNYWSKGRMMKPSPDKWGHLQVGLNNNTSPKVRRVHNLVMEAFVGPRPEGMETRHLNGIPSDNRLSNLTYGTRSENRMDMVKHGVHNMARKTHCVRGHLLQEPNLLPSVTKKGYRSCKACSRARSRVRYNPAIDFQAESDRQYLIILEESLAG